MSPIGTKRTSRHVRYPVAIVCIADIEQTALSKLDSSRSCYSPIRGRLPRSGLVQYSFCDRVIEFSVRCISEDNSHTHTNTQSFERSVREVGGTGQGYWAADTFLPNLPMAAQRKRLYHRQLPT